jgi:hypothetical protein
LGGNGVVPLGNDAISPREAMTEITFDFANPANPWSSQNTGLAS